MVSGCGGEERYGGEGCVQVPTTQTKKAME